mgnify:FL=1
MIKGKNFLQFEGLNAYSEIGHLFTLKPFNFRAGMVGVEEVRKEYKRIQQILAMNSIKFIKPSQAHTNCVKCVMTDTLNENLENVDGLITDMKGVALVTSLADCQGILLYDSKKKVIGNIHSGWRGTIGCIVENAVHLMEDIYHCEARDIEAYICPSILKCCFEVEEDVKEEFVHTFSDLGIEKDILKKRDGKYLIDTVSINRKILIKLGVLPENIVTSDICTKCHGDIMHSYRVDKENSGRNIAVIVLR